MTWMILVMAGLLEVAWAWSMKLSAGFTKPLPTILTLVLMAASFGLLSLSMRSLPLGTAYTIWTGIGAIGAFIVGVVALGEQLSALRIAAALLIVAGLVLMKLATPS